MLKQPFLSNLWLKPVFTIQRLKWLLKESFFQINLLPLGLKPIHCQGLIAALKCCAAQKLRLERVFQQPVKGQSNPGTYATAEAVA